MDFLSPQETERWLAARRSAEVTLRSASYRLGVDAGAKTALARALSALFDDGLLWVTATGIFPSSENPALFDGYRRALGETRSVLEAPGHRFDRSSRTELECLLGLVLYFFWDASLYDEAGATSLRISHDEVISLQAADEQELTRLEDVLARLGLEPAA